MHWNGIYPKPTYHQAFLVMLYLKTNQSKNKILMICLNFHFVEVAHLMEDTSLESDSDSESAFQVIIQTNIFISQRMSLADCTLDTNEGNEIPPLCSVRTMRLLDLVGQAIGLNIVSVTRGSLIDTVRSCWNLLRKFRLKSSHLSSKTAEQNLPRCTLSFVKVSVSCLSAYKGHDHFGLKFLHTLQTKI